MKLSSLSVKRRTVKKGPLRKLYANVARKKHRATTAAAPLPSYEGDVPNLGIARALIVILIIHVVAIAGIFAHSHWFESADEAVAAANQPQIEPARPLREAGMVLPKIQKFDETYIPVAGDSYASIAVKHGVTEDELREANGDMPLSSGSVMRIPAATGNTIVAVEPEELTELRHSRVPEVEVPIDEIYTAPMIETDAAARAVLVRPNVTRQPEAGDRPAEQPAVASAPSGRKHTVKAGDTFWSISQNYSSTPDQLMKANGITDPRKLRVGMELRIP
ncbi:LysM peptidoglycan-binding domain-containing protein [Luteolibacter marinus]|uniref:LysM peptidoglycan-binding domain-containing protein n=1 Tax=Luteolibacter marinus TaxID=2776705 RepID=UPI001868C94E|nr:LysM domain-containing protein [Luteolibacter marinus]